MIGTGCQGLGHCSWFINPFRDHVCVYSLLYSQKNLGNKHYHKKRVEKHRALIIWKDMSYKITTYNTKSRN
jgi:hypothetical protein